MLPTILEPEESNPAVGTSRENLYVGSGTGEEESYRPGGRAVRALELPVPVAAAGGGGGLNDLSANPSPHTAGNTPSPMSMRRARWSYASPPTGELSPRESSGASRSPSVRLARVSVATASPTLSPDLLRPPENYLAARRSSTQSLVEQVRCATLQSTRRIFLV